MSGAVDSIGKAEGDIHAKSRRYGLYAALKYVPIAGYAVFVILIFIAFACPLALYDSVNSGIAVDTPGSIYTTLGGLLDFDIHICHCVITLYVAAPVAVGYGIFAAWTCFKGKFGKRNPEDGIGATFAGNVCSGCYIVYIIFAALDLIILCRILVLDGGNGVIRVGAATVTVLISELVMTVISISCEIVRWRMEKKNGELRGMEQLRFKKR